MTSVSFNFEEYKKLYEKMDENYIRRERQRKEETKRAVAEMRAALKVCNMDDVRRHKLPFHEALLIGLEEKGYYVTAAFIQQLIDFQTELTEKAGPSSVLWTKPQLNNTKNILKILSDSLVKAEQSHRTEKYAEECETFLKISTHIAFLHQDWWWLGEQLLLQSINIAKDYPILDGKYEALSRYSYAKFLIENFKETGTAQEHLNIVRKLSIGKRWSTKMLFSEDKDFVDVRTNYLLHLCFMQEARGCMKTDYSRAIKLSALARKRAAEACYLEGETKALLLKGICETSAKCAIAAIATFSKAFHIQQRIGNLEGVCATSLHLAQAYLMNGDTVMSLKTLVDARKCAEQNELYYYLAEAYKHLGEFYLNNGEPKRATPLLGEALKILHETECIQESEQVRNLEAISTGLELFPKYLKLLSSSGHPETGLESLMKMIDWKDSRKQFWSQEDESSESSVHMSDELKAESSIEEEEKEEEEHQTSTQDKNVEEECTKEEVVELHTNVDEFQRDSYTDISQMGYESLASNEEKLNPKKAKANESIISSESRVASDDKSFISN